MQTNFTAEQLRDPATAAVQPGAAHLRALRLLHRDLPDLRAARRRTRQPARAHLPDQGHAGNRPARHRGGGAACRPLPVLPVLHDHLPLRRALHASGRSRPDLYRAHLPPALARARCCAALLAAVLPHPGRFRARAGRRRGWRGRSPGCCRASGMLFAAAAGDAGDGAGARCPPPARSDGAAACIRAEGARRVPRGAAGRLRPAGAGPGDQRRHHPPADPPGRRGGGGRRAPAAAAR